MVLMVKAIGNFNLFKTHTFGGYSMDFLDQLQALSVRISKQVENIKTEEATKNAFVLPFIQSLPDSKAARAVRLLAAKIETLYGG